MTTPPIKRRRTAQQILLRRACQTKGVTKSQDADAGIFDKNRNGGIVVLPTVGRDLGRTQERSPTRTVAKVRKFPAPSTFVIPAERKTAGKLTICESLKEDPLAYKKLKPNAGKRSASGQRSGYTSRGSTKSQNSNSYPSKWPKNLSQEEDLKVNSKESLEELTQCSPLNRTPYDHNLNMPIKLADSSQCPPIKKKARRRTLKSAMLSGTQILGKPQQSTKTERKRESSQSCKARISRRVYSGEEVRHTKCPSKSNSEISNNSSKCKLNSGNTFKNYGGYSPSDTEYDTSVEIDHHFRCSDSFYKNIDKVSRPPSMYMNNGIWSLDLPSEMEMQEFLNRAEEEDNCANMNFKSGESERKSRKGCATEAYTGCGRSKRSPEEARKSSSRNSVKFRCSNCNECDYTSHGSAREESYHMERPCGECGHIHKQSNGCESGLGTGGTRREPTNSPYQSRLSRPAYTMGACWGSHGAGNCGRGGQFEIECGCKPTEAFANRNCIEAITQTSKIIMTKRIDESVSHSTPNYSSFAETRSCPLSSSRQETFHSSFTEPKSIKDDFGETELNAQLKAVDINVSGSSKQEQCNSEQRSKDSSVPVVKSNSLIFQSDPKKVNLVRSNSVEFVPLSSSQRTCKQELPSSSSCQQKLPPPSLPCKQALSPSSPKGSCNSRNQQNCHQSNSYNQQNCQQSNSYNQQNGQHSNSYNQQNGQHSNSYNQQNCQHSNSYNQQNGQQSNSYNQQNSQQSNSYNQENCQQSNSYNQQNCHQSNSHHQQNCHQSSSQHQQNCHQSNSHHQQNCHQSNSQHQHNSHQCREHRSDQDCPSVTASLCECNHNQAKLCKRKSRNPRKRVRRSSRGRSRSASAKKDVNGCNDDDACNERRTQSYEDCYNNRTNQMEDQCDVNKILSILQKTVAGLEEEIKRGKVCESGRRKNRAHCEQENTNLSHESTSSSPCQQELPSCSPPIQQACCSTTPLYQQELSSSTPLCQQELPTSTSNPPCQQEPTSSKAHCQYGLSHTRPFCQPRSSLANQPCQPGWASSYKPHNCHHHGCVYSNAYSQLNNGAVPNSFGRTYQANNPYKYGMHSTGVYQDRKALPLACNWNQNNQRFLKTAYRNNQDLGMARGCTKTEQNYQSNMNGQKTHQYPYTYTQPTYITPYKQHNRSTNDPKGHSTFPYTNWFRNNPQACLPPGTSLARNEMTLDETQFGSQEPINRGRVTFQKHLSIRSARAHSYQTDSSVPYGNCCGEMKTDQPNAHHKKPCKPPKNVDNLRKEVCYTNTETLCPKSLAPAECHHGSPQVHELKKSCAMPVQRILKEIDCEDCENSNTSDRCLVNLQEINLEACENKNSYDKFPRNRQDIDSEICENPNCPHRFHRHKRELDLEDCENPNCPYRSKRKIIPIDVEVCENPNCPYRYPNDSKVGGNPKCPYRFSRNREEIDLEVCGNPNCPYRCKRNREDIDTEICENTTSPYRFKPTIKEIDLVDICENTSCPFRFPRNLKDIDLDCENPNCPYRMQRNMTEIDSEVYEYSNTLKRSPNICASKLKKKRACPIPYQEISDSTLSEDPQDLCEAISSSIESCEDPHCPVNKNNMWLSGGFESFESNSVEYKTEENGFKEVATDSCHDGLTRRQRVVFTDVTNKTNRQDSGQSDRLDDDSIKTKPFSKKWGHRYLNLDKIPINTASGVQPLGCNRNRRNPYLTSDPNLNYDKHCYQKHKIENCRAREPVKVCPPVCRPKNRTRPRNYNCNRSTIEPCNAKHLLFLHDDECSSTSTSSCCSCSIPQRITNCQDNPRCCKRRERPRSQREQPPETHIYETHIYLSGNESSSFVCCRKENYCKTSNESKKDTRKNCEKSTSKSSLFSCFKKIVKPSQKREKNISEKERCKNAKKSTSKSSSISCLKRKKQKEQKEQPPPSLISILKKKEQPCPAWCKEVYPSTGRRTIDNDLQCEINMSKLCACTCCKKNEQSASLQTENCAKNGRKNYKRENDSQCEKTKSKSKALPCPKKKEKIPPPKCHAKKEKHADCENKNDSQIKKNKSKSSGFLCFKKKEKHPCDQCENYAKKGCRNIEKESELHCELTKKKSSGLLCCKKIEKTVSFQEYIQCEKNKPNLTKKENQEENCCKKERRKYAENENEIPKECEKKPSWLKVFPRCRRKPKCKCKDKGDDISEDQEKTKKPSNLTKCFSCCRKSKTRKEPCNQCEECKKYQSTGPYQNVEVRVLYDSSFRFKQESCSCFDIAENTYCDNPQEGSTSSNGSENRHRQCECGNEFYKIGQ